MSDRNWTAEEYREYLRTGKEPITRSDGATRIPARADMEAMKRNIPENSVRPAVSPTCCQPGRSIAQEEIEAAWERAEKEGRVMALDIPTDTTIGTVQISENTVIQGRGLPVQEEKRELVQRLRDRVSVYTASRLLEERGIHGAKIVLPKNEKPKRNKYGNEKITDDGITFDSKHEHNVYCWLKARRERGELRWVFVHVPFRFINGTVYWADFMTIRADGTIEAVWDAKSKPTAEKREYINKKKSLKAEWGIDIREVMRDDADGRGGFYNADWI